MLQAEPVKNNFLSGSQKSDPNFGNGADLRLDSGSAASSGSIYEWYILKSDLYCGAISTPAGAVYLSAGRVRSCSPISLWTNQSPLRLVLSSLAVRGFIG